MSGNREELPDDPIGEPIGREGRRRRQREQAAERAGPEFGAEDIDIQDTIQGPTPQIAEEARRREVREDVAEQAGPDFAVTDVDVEEGEEGRLFGFVSEEARRRELREDVAAQAGAGFGPGDVQIQEGEDGLTASISPSAQEREARESLLADVGDDFGPEDIVTERTGEGVTARISGDAVEEARATATAAAEEDAIQQVLERDFAEGFTAEDVVTEETDEGVTARLSESAVSEVRAEQRAELRETAAQEAGEAFAPGDITIQETDAGLQPEVSQAAQERELREAAEADIREDFGADVADTLTVEPSGPGEFAVEFERDGETVEQFVPVTEAAAGRMEAIEEAEQIATRFSERAAARGEAIRQAEQLATRTDPLEQQISAEFGTDLQRGEDFTLTSEGTAELTPTGQLETLEARDATIAAAGISEQAVFRGEGGGLEFRPSAQRALAEQRAEEEIAAELGTTPEAIEQQVTVGLRAGPEATQPTPTAPVLDPELQRELTERQFITQLGEEAGRDVTAEEFDLEAATFPGTERELAQQGFVLGDVSPELERDLIEPQEAEAQLERQIAEQTDVAVNLQAEDFELGIQGEDVVPELTPEGEATVEAAVQEADQPFPGEELPGEVENVQLPFGDATLGERVQATAGLQRELISEPAGEAAALFVEGGLPANVGQEERAFAGEAAGRFVTGGAELLNVGNLATTGINVAGLGIETGEALVTDVAAGPQGPTNQLRFTETARVGGETGAFAGEQVSALAGQFRQEPLLTTAGLAGGVAASGGAIAGARRFGGPTLSRSVSATIQPGEELAIGAARRGLIGEGTATAVPGVRSGQFRSDLAERISTERSRFRTFVGEERGQADLTLRQRGEGETATQQPEPLTGQDVAERPGRPRQTGPPRREALGRFERAQGTEGGALRPTSIRQGRRTEFEPGTRLADLLRLEAGELQRPETGGLSLTALTQEPLVTTQMQSAQLEAATETRLFEAQQPSVDLGLRQEARQRTEARPLFDTRLDARSALDQRLDTRTELRTDVDVLSETRQETRAEARTEARTEARREPLGIDLPDLRGPDPITPDAPGDFTERQFVAGVADVALGPGDGDTSFNLFGD